MKKNKETIEDWEEKFERYSVPITDPMTKEERKMLATIYKGDERRELPLFMAKKILRKALKANDKNSGYRNSGDCNSGNWNSGDKNSGMFNTNEPNVRMFNKDTSVKWEDVKLPNFFYFNLNEWIQEEAMTDEEKKEYPEYKITGGYLRMVEYKDAWRKAWDNAKLSERKKVLDLPNYDNKIFKEITGIDAERELKEKRGKMIKVGGKKYSEDTIREALKQHVI